jgi:hypothetical protein
VKTDIDPCLDVLLSNTAQSGIPASRSRIAELLRAGGTGTARVFCPTRPAIFWTCEQY